MRSNNTIKRIARDIEPLAAWLRVNKPQCPAITLQRRDVSCLRTNSEVARRYGFTVTPDEIRFDGFLVRALAETESPS